MSDTDRNNPPPPGIDGSGVPPLHYRITRGAGGMFASLRDRIGPARDWFLSRWHSSKWFRRGGWGLGAMLLVLIAGSVSGAWPCNSRISPPS